MQSVITKKGRELIAKLLINNQPLTFTRAAVGSGDLIAGVEIADYTSLVDYVMDASISDYEYKGDYQSEISVQVISTGVTQTFEAKEVGIFASDPDKGEILFLYLPAQDDPQTVYSETSEIQKLVIFDIGVVISDIANIVATIDPNSLVTAADLEEFVMRMPVATTEKNGLMSSSDKQEMQIFKNNFTAMNTKLLSYGIFYVDNVNGSDDNDGRSIEKPFKTVEAYGKKYPFVKTVTVNIIGDYNGDITVPSTGASYVAIKNADDDKTKTTVNGKVKAVGKPYLHLRYLTINCTTSDVIIYDTSHGLISDCVINGAINWHGVSCSRGILQIINTEINNCKAAALSSTAANVEVWANCSGTGNQYAVRTGYGAYLYLQDGHSIGYTTGESIGLNINKSGKLLMDGSMIGNMENNPAIQQLNGNLNYYKLYKYLGDIGLTTDATINQIVLAMGMPTILNLAVWKPSYTIFPAEASTKGHLQIINPGNQNRYAKVTYEDVTNGTQWIMKMTDDDNAPASGEWIKQATKSDLDYLKIKPVYNPEKTGKNTLHEFILSEIARIGCTEMSFTVSKFSDLPRQDWGYGCHVQYSSGHYTVFLYMETNNAVYLRTANSAGWENEWERIATKSDLESKAILTDPPNTEVPDLNTFTTLNKRVGINIATLNKPDGASSFGTAINIGYAANVFTQILIDNDGTRLYYRQYISWAPTVWSNWKIVATAADLSFVKTRVNQSPENTGKATLLEFLKAKIAETGSNELIYWVVNFPDLPQQSWGFLCRAYRSGNGAYVYLHKELSSTSWYRATSGAMASWYTDWQTVATSTDLANYLPLTGGNVRGAIRIKEDAIYSYRTYDGIEYFSYMFPYSHGSGDNKSIRFCIGKPGTELAYLDISSTGIYHTYHMAGHKLAEEAYVDAHKNSYSQHVAIQSGVPAQAYLWAW